VYAADNELADMASNEGDPTRVLIRQILGAVAQWEKSVIVAKLKAGADKKRRETGRCGGVVPYGEMPGEGGVLVYLLDLHKNGESLTNIALAANARGYLTRNRKQWTKARVHNAIARHTGVKL
jgi:DNA invertase Pin-like site-specific DNA recombinase